MVTFYDSYSQFYGTISIYENLFYILEFLYLNLIITKITVRNNQETTTQFMHNARNIYSHPRYCTHTTPHKSRPITITIEYRNTKNNSTVTHTHAQLKYG